MTGFAPLPGVTMLTLLAALATVPVAHAAPPPVTVSLAAGYFWTLPAETIASTWTFVPRLGTWVKPHWGAEIDFGVAKGVTRRFGNPYWGLTPRVNVLYNVLPDKRIQPFIAAGPGAIRTKVDREAGEAGEAKGEGQVDNFENPDLDFMLNAGPGLFFEVNHRLLLRTDLRYMLNIGTERIGDRADVFSDFEWTVGLTLRFGGEKPAKLVDTDGDGLMDDVDACVDGPEDPDGFEDDDGCPDPDNDGDGVPDVDDGAPMEPEDPDDFEDTDGVPDPDNDGDGVEDVDDACPLEPEDRDEFEDDDGCPDPDHDGDGFLDAEDDQCPDVPGNWRGCPDRDEDSLLDDDDACPDEWGPADGDGCPQKVQVTEEAIVILEKVYFDVNKATIKEKSFDILDEVAQVMSTVDRIKMVEVAGHTDSDGTDEDNLALSQARAEAVVQYLVDKGISAARMNPVGYGEANPIESNNTSAGKARNRRVEFVITDQEGDTGVQTE